MKTVNLQYSYKKNIGFTKIQQKSMKILESYGVNVNQFIRQSIKEKLQRDWKGIKIKKDKVKTPF